jgi:signal peptidase II
LTYVENRGAAFGTMMGGRWFFVALTVIVVVAGGIYYSKIYNKDKSKIASLALVLVAGGAIGNCIDRLFRGYVVDMLSFNFFGYSFPVFNFADICVVIGAVLLVVSLCFTKEGK